MSHLNPKNRLQEYLLLRGESLPIYKSMKMGEAHKSLFIAQVFIHASEFPFCNGAICSTKKGAESTCAEKAYKLLMDENQTICNSQQIKTHSPLEHKCYVYVDLENVGDCGSVIKEIAPREGLEIVGFVGKLHHHAFKKELFGERMKIQTIPSAHKDGCDIGMGIIATKLLFDMKENETLIILSRDHWAAAWVECINNNIITFDNLFNVIHCTNTDEIKNHINF